MHNGTRRVFYVKCHVLLIKQEAFCERWMWSPKAKPSVSPPRLLSRIHLRVKCTNRLKESGRRQAAELRGGHKPNTFRSVSGQVCLSCRKWLFWVSSHHECLFGRGNSIGEVIAVDPCKLGGPADRFTNNKTDLKLHSFINDFPPPLPHVR